MHIGNGNPPNYRRQSLGGDPPCQASAAYVQTWEYVSLAPAARHKRERIVSYTTTPPASPTAAEKVPQITAHVFLIAQLPSHRWFLDDEAWPTEISALSAITDKVNEFNIDA